MGLQDRIGTEKTLRSLSDDPWVWVFESEVLTSSILDQRSILAVDVVDGQRTDQLLWPVAEYTIDVGAYVADGAVAPHDRHDIRGALPHQT